MATKAPPTEESLPPGLQSAARRAGENAADAVAEFLDALGFRRPVSSEPPARLPAGLLLGLGVGLRLLDWEARGLHVHRVAGLPTAMQGLAEVIRRAGDAAAARPDPFVVSLYTKVNELSVRLFAWERPPILGADFVIDGASGTDDADGLVEAIAHLLWECRHSGDHHVTIEKPELAEAE